jgi:DNA end-binding protein Ku
MPRAIWKGTVSFGLVNVPIGLYPVERTGTHLHFQLLDNRDKAHVRYMRVNEVTGEEVPWNEVVKAYEDENGQFIVLSEEDFEKAAPRTSHTIEIEDFVPAGSVNTLFFDKPYYIVPSKGAEKGYVLLREALRQTQTVGIARVTIRTREHLAALVPEGDALVLDLIRFPEELRNADEYGFPAQDLERYKVQPRELDMARRLVEAMISEWKPEQYHDRYRELLLKFVEEKQRRGEAAQPPAPEVAEEGVEAGAVIDMTEMLKRSVQKTQRERRQAHG